VSKGKWHRLIESGLLIPRFTNVAVVFGSPDSLEQRICAATMAGDGRGIASHRSAAYLWGAWTPRADDGIDVISASRRHVDRNDGRDTSFVTHTPRDLLNLAPVAMDGIRTTSATRTLLDFAAVESRNLQVVAERMLLNGNITRRRIKAAVAQHSERGRAGIGAVRELLANWPYSDERSESVLELRMQTLLSGSVFRDYVTQLEIGPYRVDFAWPRWKVVAECDGFAKIESSRDIEKWMVRDSYLMAAGWAPVHLSWRQINFHRSQALGIVSNAFISHGWHPGLPVS